MDTLIGLAILTGYVWGIVIIFGGHKNAPQWLRIMIGIAQIALLVAFIGLATIV